MSTEKPFEINVIDIHWLKNIDERNDLCAHGFLYLKIAANVSLLELVAAYGKLFFHNRPSEVMKGKLTIYRKTSHKF